MEWFMQCTPLLAHHHSLPNNRHTSAQSFTLQWLKPFCLLQPKRRVQPITFRIWKGRAGAGNPRASSRGTCARERARLGSCQQKTGQCVSVIKDFWKWGARPVTFWCMVKQILGVNNTNLGRLNFKYLNKKVLIKYLVKLNFSFVYTCSKKDYV